VEIHYRKMGLLEKKVVEQGEGGGDEVEYGGDAASDGGRQKPRDGVTSMTSLKKCYQAV